MARILVIDEEPLIHDVIRDALEDEGHAVVGCCRFEEARALLGDPADLVFLHPDLPDGNCRTLVDEASSFGNPAIVLIASRPGPDIEAERGRCETLEVLYKPLDPMTIRGSVKRCLAKAAPEIEIPDSPRILVVDDDEMVRLSVTDVLEDRGYAVSVAGSGPEALEILGSGVFEIVLTDVMMGEMSGLDLLRELPQKSPRSIAIVMTGYANKKLAIEALKNGAYDLLEKPLSPDLITLAVKRAWEAGRYALENRRLLSDLRRANSELLLAKDEAEAASRAKSEFLANMSHEVRTPLNGVLGCLSMLGQTELDTAQSRFVGVARDAGENLLSLLTDILDYAAEASALPPRSEEGVDLRDLLGGVIDQARARVEEAGLTLNLSFASSLPETVTTDPRHLSRILANLLDNARKFTPAGGISVHARPEADRVRILVRDTGPGIPSEMREKVLQPFFQADGGVTRKAGGIGLGLALANRLVDALGGSLEIADAPSGGGEVSILLPIRAAAEERPAEPPPKSSLEILLADDDSTNIFVFERMLQKLGHHVTSVKNGRLAVSAYRETTFDLVLLDYQMPILDGPNAAREIRRFEEETGRARSRIVSITGFALAEYEALCRLAGMDDFLTKPIRLAELRRITADLS